EDSLASRRGCAQLRDKAVELFDVRLGQSGSSLRVMIRHSKANDLTLPIDGDISALSEVPARIFHASIAVKFSKLKLLDQLVLNRAARENADKNVARAFKSEHSTSDPSQACGTT